MSYLLLLLLGLGQEPKPLQEPLRAVWLPQRAEIWVLEADAEQPRVFDPWLREKVGAAANAQMPAGGGLELPVWSRRTLSVDPELGTMSLGPAPWEREPVLRWGPGWGVVELRSAFPAAPLRWRRPGEGRQHVAQFRVEAMDALIQRAWIEGVSAGETIEVLLIPPRPVFPPAPEPEWVELQVPEVDPAGARPTAAWPRE